MKALEKLWARLTEPHHAIREPEKRGRAKLLASLALLATLLCLVFMIVDLFFREASPAHWQTRVTAISLDSSVAILFAGVYVLSRTQHYTLAAFLLVGAASGSSFLALFLLPPDPLFLAFLLLGILSSGLFLSRRATMIVFGATLLGLAGVARLFSFSRLDLITALFLIISVTALAQITYVFHEQDLKQIKQQARQLAESEEDYRSIFENAMDGIFQSTPGGKFLRVNPAMARIFGYVSPQEMTASVGDIRQILYINPDKREEWKRLLEENGSAIGFEVQERHKDGSVIWTLSNTHAVCDACGTLLYYEGVLQDITLRKQAEEALFRRAEELAALQATMLEIITIHNVKDVLQAIVERSVALLLATSGGLYLCDPERQEVRCVVSYNTPRDFTGTVLKYGVGAAGVVALSGQPLIIDDYRAWSGRAEAFEEEQPFAAVLSVPMIWHGQVTGVIHVLRNANVECFTQADQDLLTLFANHAAIAVENARLHEAMQLELEQRKKAEEALRLDGQIMANMANGVILVRVSDQAIIFTNPQFETMFGYGTGELIGKHISIINAPTDKSPEEIAQDIMKALKEDGIWKGEIQSVRKDGTTFWSYASVSTFEHGTYGTVWIAAHQDITTRKQAEEMIRISEERFRTILNELQDGFYEVDLKGNFTFFNPAYSRTLGFDEEEMMGLNYRSYMSQETAQAVYKTYNKVYRTGIPQQAVSMEMIRKNGTYRFMETSISLIKTDGKIEGFRGLVRDVTERKRAEETLRKAHDELEVLIQKRTAQLEASLKALRTSEERLRFLVAASPAVIYTSKTSGDFAATFLSENVTTQLSYTARDFVDDPNFWASHIYPEDAPRVFAGLPHLFETGHLVHEYRFRHQNGEWRWMRDEMTLVRDATGAPLEIIGCLFDITERKEAEEKITAALQEKEILLREIHHRVKNNLQVISSLLNLQSDYLSDEHALQVFKQTQNRLRSMALIHDQLHTGTNLAALDFAGYIEKLTRYLFQTYGVEPDTIRLQLDIAGIALPLETAIPCGLLVHELVSNALEHGFPNRAGGNLWIRMRHKGGRYRLVVGNDGVALPQAVDIRHPSPSAYRWSTCWWNN